MDARPIIAAAGLLLGVGLLGYVLWDTEVKLIPLPEAARGKVEVDPAAARPSLVGLRTTTSPHNTGDAARRERNRIAAAWIEALQQREAGKRSQGEVERIEMELWVQRLHTGEVTASQVHEALAALFERELTRRKRLLDQGFASENDVRKAEVLLARERFAAGQDATDYPARRASYLQARRRHLLLLARSGVMVKDVAVVEIEALEKELPEPDALRPAKPAGSKG